MSQEGVEGFLGRLLTDIGYRHLAQNSLSIACHEAGYDLTDDELMAIKREDLMRIELISEGLDCKLKRLNFELKNK